MAGTTAENCRKIFLTVGQLLLILRVKPFIASMRTWLQLLLLGVVRAGWVHREAAMARPGSGECQPVASRVLIIYYDAQVGSGALEAAVKHEGCQVLYRYAVLKGMAVRAPERADVERLIRRLQRVRGVLSVQRDQLLQLD